MKKRNIAFIIFSTSVCVILYNKIFPSVLELCELEACPNCFGIDMCPEIKKNKITLQYSSLSDFIYNVFSVKNVYFARYNNISVVLKKLAHDNELKELNVVNRENVQYEINIADNTAHVKPFRVCDTSTANLFLKTLSYKDDKYLEILLHTNIEPLLLEIFSNSYGWCVPKLYGFCGRLVVVQNSGQPLNEMQNVNWFDRAYLAYQLLEAVNNFTKKHDTFSLYLTDISPDNIVIDQDLKVTFIDLENVILKKNNVNGVPHYSEHFDEDSYIYSETQICKSSVSDHNIYSICRLILSKEALWPMMKNGLLHSPPRIIKEHFNKLFDDIELCVYSKDNINRFQLSDSILQLLRNILNNYTKYKYT